MSSQQSQSLMSPSQSTPDSTLSGASTITPSSTISKQVKPGRSMTEESRKRFQRKRESRARKKRRSQISPGQTTMTQSFPTRSELRKMKEDARQLD